MMTDQVPKVTTTGPTTAENRALVRRRWQALYDACYAAHERDSNGSGGAAICICGSCGGGHDACSMLREIVELIRYMPVDELPEAWQTKLQLWRSML